MAIPREDVVRRVLAPREHVLLSAVLSGWTDCKVHALGWWRRKSTRAGVMWEATIDRAIGGLQDASGVRIVPHYDTRSFIFDDIVLCRFKKGDVARFTSNYPTPLAVSFHAHRQDLFGYSGLMRVEIVHTLNRRQTEIESVAIVARDRRRIFWHYELGIDAASVAPVLPFGPLPLLPSGPRPTREIARPRAPAEPGEGKEGE
jgi:hypothetical protein